MKFTTVSGVVSKLHSMGDVSCELDGKPVNIKAVTEMNDIEGHRITVVGKQKDSGFSGVGYYDETNGTTHKGMFMSMIPLLFIAVSAFLGLIFLLVFFIFSLVFFGLGVYFYIAMYQEPNKLLSSLKK